LKLIHKHVTSVTRVKPTLLIALRHTSLALLWVLQLAEVLAHAPPTISPMSSDTSSVTAGDKAYFLCMLCIGWPFILWQKRKEKKEDAQRMAQQK
jgi:hypothetical protein